MAFTSSKFGFSAQSILEKSIAGVEFPLNPTFLKELFVENGTALGECDRIIQGRVTIADAATPQVINLNNASALDPVGDAAQMAKVCLIALFNAQVAGSPTHIVSIGGGANPFIAWNADASDIRKLHPQGLELAWNFSTDAWACGAGANNLQLDADAGTDVPIDYLILGRSA